MMDPMTAVDVTVSGRVQGVGFRMSTAQEARRLGVAGWVRNEPDGSVAAHLEGDEDAVRQLVDWCRRGPAYAEVGTLDVRPGKPSGAPGFEVRHG
jgi:acylphosphatase